MESREGDPLPQAPQKTTGFDKNTHAHESSPHLDPFTDQPLDQSLVKDFQKLNFFKDDDGTEEKDNDYLAGSNSIGDNSQYPLRPHAEDCIFYLKTGRCGFGFACKFNHPERKTWLESKDRIFGVEEQEEDDKQRRDFVEKRGQIECKYYLTPQGCKYGKACRYSHSQEKYMIAPSKLDVQEEKEREGFVEQTRLIECKYYGMPGGCKFGKACKYYHFKENVEREPPEVNFLDLPIRPLEKECPFFMRTSSCRYGVDCKYHHPNPISVGGSDLSNSNDNGVVGGDYSLGNCNRIWNTQQPMEPAIPDAASGPPNFVSSDADAKLDNVSSYASDMHSLLEKMQLKPASNQHQVPIYPQRGPYSSPFGNKQTRIPDVLPNHQDQINGLDFPERPGQPECNYYLVTGNCKYRSACRYHHPKNRASKVAAGACILGNNGLPLRPGKKICGHYERYGICKYGSGCLFHHPENYALPSF